MPPRPRIAIDALIRVGGTSGGVEQFIVTLLEGLARFESDAERYVLVCPDDTKPIWEPRIGSNTEIHTVEPRQRVRWVGSPRIRSAASEVRGYLRRAFGLPPRALPASDGLYEKLGVKVVHFPHQGFLSSSVPSIYNPHDVQHRVFPQFFTGNEIAFRDALYATGCRQASAIVASSHHTKASLLEWLDLDDAKIHVIPHASPSISHPNDPAAFERLRRDLNLPNLFALLPAQTWPHKNHLRLLDALHRLREESAIHLSVVLTGLRNEYWPVIQRRVVSLGLQAQVRALDYVDDLVLASLYEGAAFLVFPSLYEGTGLPVLEAIARGMPIACSDIEVFREYASGAALYFDPSSTDSIANALKQMVSNPQVRAELAQKSRERADLFTADRVAKSYRALYRSVGDLPMDPEDRRLLAESFEAPRRDHEPGEGR